MQLSQIWRHPVKSLGGEILESGDVEATGLAFDRAFGIIDDATGRIVTGRREPKLLFGTASIGVTGELSLELPSDDGNLQISVPHVGTREADSALSDWIGRPVHLALAKDHEVVTAESYTNPIDESSALREWQLPKGRFVDSAPLLLVTTQTLQSGKDVHPNGRWDVRRFRPNLVIDAHGTSWLEDGWTSMQISIGEVELRVKKPCGRCTMITRAQPGIEADLEIFRTLAHEHGATFGVLCDVVRPGTISVGDELVVSN